MSQELFIFVSLGNSAFNILPPLCQMQTWDARRVLLNFVFLSPTQEALLKDASATAQTGGCADRVRTRDDMDRSISSWETPPRYRSPSSPPGLVT